MPECHEYCKYNYLGFCAKYKERILVSKNPYTLRLTSSPTITRKGACAFSRRGKLRP